MIKVEGRIDSKDAATEYVMVERVRGVTRNRIGGGVGGVEQRRLHKAQLYCKSKGSRVATEQRAESKCDEGSESDGDGDVRSEFGNRAREPAGSETIAFESRLRR